jgi:hypothetical protein
MVEPAGMWPGAGSGPDGRRLATHAALALTTLLPLIAAFPVATPAGDGTAELPVVMVGGGAAVPHAAISDASRHNAAPVAAARYPGVTHARIVPRLMTPERV